MSVVVNFKVNKQIFMKSNYKYKNGLLPLQN